MEDDSRVERVGQQQGVGIRDPASQKYTRNDSGLSRVVGPAVSLFAEAGVRKFTDTPKLQQGSTKRTLQTK